MLSSAVKNQPELSITRDVQIHQPEMVEFCRKLSYTIIIQKEKSDFNQTAKLLRRDSRDILKNAGKSGTISISS